MIVPTYKKLFLFTRIAIIIFVLGAIATLFVCIGKGGGGKITAQDFVNLQQGNEVHEGFRRAHAKGFCISGVLDSNGSLAPYTTATIFSEAVTPFIGRLSISGNNPSAPDLLAPVRSLALSFLSEQHEVWRTAMNTPPVMAVRDPYDFYQQLLTLVPDPDTKKRDPNRIKAFFKQHPESKAFTEWAASYTPKNSFAAETYNSINAFYLIDSYGKKQAVRWRLSPDNDITANVLATEAEDKNALHKEFFNRLENGAVTFDLIFTLASSEDDENDPTQLWPATRQQISAGQLSITEAHTEQEGLCNAINFDPLILPKGMEATEDKILRARSSAYAESYRRRAREHLIGLSEQ